MKNFTNNKNIKNIVEKVKTAVLLTVVMLAIGFTLGIHYEKSQQVTVNQQVQAQLSAIKK
jgi:uncharacterized membrane protein